MPRIHKTWDLRSDKKVWTSTYWPMANHTRRLAGNPTENLWADNGALDKFDRVLKARKEDVGAKKFEKTPALNWLIDESFPSGFYVAKPTIREANAERTTGVDFTGNGKIAGGIKRYLFDDFGEFGFNGKKTGTMVLILRRPKKFLLIST